MLGLLDSIAPIRCIVCDRGSLPLCFDCLEQVDFLWFEQQGPKVLDSITCMARFAGPLVTYVHEMKFGPNRPCAEYGGELLFRHTNWVDATAVTCAPLSRWRKWERGFNQAELMARMFAQLSGLPFLPLLIKEKFTSPQAETKTREERLSRLAGSFGVNQGLGRMPKSVIVIDDVCTTGATLAECGATLRLAGVEEVHALTLCREL